MAEFNDPAGKTFRYWAEPVPKQTSTLAPQRAIPIAPRSRPSVAIPILAGAALASIVVAVGLPWLLTGELQLTSWTVKGPLLVTSFTTSGWFVWRMRGSEIRAHGGWQLWPPALVMVAVAGLLLLTGCKDSPIDPARRSGAQTANAGTTTQQGGKSAEDAEWDRVLQAPGPTAEHLPAKCPGASNAEIDAALQSDKPWTCDADGGQ